MQLKRGVAPEEHRKMKMQHAAAMRDVMLASGARKVRMHDSKPTPSPSHAALQRELQDVSGKVQLKRGVAPEEHRKMKMQHAAAMRDVMLASGARKVRMHDSRPTPSPSHAALQRELQDVSGKVQLKRGVAPEEHRKMKMQHAAAMRDVMLASGARKVRMHDSRPTPSPSHAALQRELQDISGKVQLKRGVAPEETSQDEDAACGSDARRHTGVFNGAETAIDQI